MRLLYFFVFDFKAEGMKAMARWLIGLKNDKVSAQKTFRMFNAFLSQKGDLTQSASLSKSELAWLRLQAGCSMLKICEQKGVGDQYTAEQFFLLSRLMMVYLIIYYLYFLPSNCIFTFLIN